MRKLVLEDLKKLLGVNGEPVFEELFVWKNAIAQYNVGYQEYLDIMDDIEKRIPNIALVGAYRGGVGVSSCLENGLLSAAKLAGRISD